MAYAKITSKGQVTIPAEVRRLLELETGDSIVLEPHGEYVVMRKAPALANVLDGLAVRFPITGPRFETQAEAVAAHAEARAKEPQVPVRVVGGRLRVAPDRGAR